MTRERYEQASEMLAKINETKDLFDLLDNSLGNDTRLVLYKHNDGYPTIINEVDTVNIKEPITIMKAGIATYLEVLENKFKVI